jgi:hypothetical protein
MHPLLALAAGASKTPVTRWFWADTRQQLPGLSLALMALMLAISANVGVATMVSSFRLTFVAFLDQRLAPELYVKVADAAQANAIETQLPDGGTTVLPLLAVDTLIAKQPTRLFGVRVGPTYRENWVFLHAQPDAWDRVSAGTAAVVNEQTGAPCWSLGWRQRRAWGGSDCDPGGNRGGLRQSTRAAGCRRGSFPQTAPGGHPPPVWATNRRS